MEEYTDTYKTIATEAIGEITEKKSRFLANLYPAETDEEALLYMEGIKKRYWDARHHCYAYIIRENGTMRCSDDGEPSGTAGRPMLDILQKENLKDVVAVVTRYFGGVLLGTGGLVRAYTQALQEGLKNASIIQMQYMDLLQIEIDYAMVGKVKHVLMRENVLIRKEEYVQSVIMETAIPIEDTQRIKKELADATDGRVLMTVKDRCFIGKTN